MKKDIFKNEIKYIKNSEYKKNTEILIELLPDYFFKIAASSTGKYHPKFALGEGGLVRHTKVAMRLAYELCNSMIGDVFTKNEKDLMIIALLFHDGLKRGEGETHTKFEHPLLAADFIEKNKEKTSFNDKEIKFLKSVIASHMGPFNTSNYSDIVLPIPKNKYQKFVHMCDLLASKKFLDVDFNILERNE